MPYNGENMNAYSNNKENNDEVSPNPPTNDEIINANYDKVNPDTPTNGWNNETIDNDEEKIIKMKLTRKQIMKNWIWKIMISKLKKLR